MSDFEYANAPESKAIAKIASSYDLFIGGKFVKPKKAKVLIRLIQQPKRFLQKLLMQIN